MITSPRRIHALFAAHSRHMNSFYNDPMTDACGCSGEIAADLDRRFMIKVKKLTGLSFYEAEKIAEDYSSTRLNRRNRHKNPVKLAWSRAESEARLHRSMFAGFDADYSEIF